MGKKILVTGGAGFIGSHLAEALLDKGYNVYVVDDLRFGYKKFVDPRAKFFQISIFNHSKLDRIMRGVDTVMHLAASSIIHDSLQKPADFFDNNVSGGIAVLESMRRNNVKKMVYSSTSSVYGEQDKVPISENVPPNPLHPYAASKLSFEYALRAYYHSYSIDSVILRYYNVYGPRDEQLPATRAIPMWMKAAVSGKPIPWFWNGMQTRDYIYVTDVVQAHLNVMELSGIHTFNIGSGKGVKMKEVLTTLEKVVGHKLKTKDLGKRAGDVSVSYADIKKIYKAVKWQPKISLFEGLVKTYDYYKTKSAN